MRSWDGVQNRQVFRSIRKKLKSYLPWAEKSDFVPGKVVSKSTINKTKNGDSKYYIMPLFNSGKKITGPFCEEELEEVITAFPLGENYKVITEADYKEIKRREC